MLRSDAVSEGFFVCILGASAALRERLGYLCALEEIACTCAAALADVPAPASGADVLVVLEADSPDSLKRQMAGRGLHHHFVVICPKISEVFLHQEELEAFFDAGGLSVLQAGWSDLAFSGILEELERTNGRVGDVELDFATQIVFHTVGHSTQGFTRQLGKRRASCLVKASEAPGDAPLDFTLFLGPRRLAHGQCQVEPGRRLLPNGERYWDVSFVGFDGVSRALLNHFLSDGLSLQTTLGPLSRCTNAETLKFLGEMLEPLGADSSFRISFECGPFGNGYELAHYPRLTGLLLAWVKRIHASEDGGARVDALDLCLKENPEGVLALYFSVNSPNLIEFRTHDHLAFDVVTLFGRLVSLKDREYLDGIGLVVEQYPEEPLEHLAFLLEER